VDGPHDEHDQALIAGTALFAWTLIDDDDQADDDAHRASPRRALPA
jgi:hypothetical protein